MIRDASAFDRTALAKGEAPDAGMRPLESVRAFFVKGHLIFTLSGHRRELAEEQRLGHVGPGPVGAMALLLISLGHTIAVFEHLGAHDARFPDPFIRSAVDSLWCGQAPNRAAAFPKET